MEYNKLVRDKIPQILEKKQIQALIHVASDAEYEEKLKMKLLEEVNEFLEDTNVEELADVLEVVYALCDLYDVSRTDLERIREEKVEKRGAFKDKIILDETKE